MAVACLVKGELTWVVGAVQCFVAHYNGVLRCQLAAVVPLQQSGALRRGLIVLGTSLPGNCSSHR